MSVGERAGSEKAVEVDTAKGPKEAEQPAREFSEPQ
jgi:hypothetical protein